MEERDKDGTPVRKHLKHAAAKGNKQAIAELTAPDFPEELDYLWSWYAELSAGRGEGMMGAAPLTWGGLGAWAHFTGHEPESWEALALFELDAARRSPDAGAEKDDEGRTEPTPVPDWLPPSKR